MTARIAVGYTLLTLVASQVVALIANAYVSADTYWQHYAYTASITTGLALTALAGVYLIGES